MDGEEKTDDVFKTPPSSSKSDHINQSDSNSKMSNLVKSEFADELPLDTHLAEYELNEELGLVKDEGAYVDSETVRIDLISFFF